MNFRITTYCLLVALTASASAAEIGFPAGRIALSHDGNNYDRDDYVASAMNLAMLHTTGLKNKLVHLDHSCHLKNKQQQYNEMLGSVNGAVKRFKNTMTLAAYQVAKSNGYDKSVPAPTQSGLKYGQHARQIFDFWKAKSGTPTPLVLVIHGGGWRGGSKERLHKFVDVSKLLDSGISVAAINYRWFKHLVDMKPPIKGPMIDCARALQFVRSQAKQLNIDPRRIGVAGGSAGACTGLWLAYHDDLADADNEDPVLRESSRPYCAAVTRPQTTLDPKQMRQWIPNATYGAHAFGLDIKQFETFLAQRDRYLQPLAEYSPIALASKDDPPVYLFFTTRPNMGKPEKDPTHSANFGVGLQKHCRTLGINCDVMYPGATGVKHHTTTDYLVSKLKEAESR